MRVWAAAWPVRRSAGRRSVRSRQRLRPRRLPQRLQSRQAVVRSASGVRAQRDGETLPLPDATGRCFGLLGADPLHVRASSGLRRSRLQHHAGALFARQLRRGLRRRWAALRPVDDQLGVDSQCSGVDLHRRLEPLKALFDDAAEKNPAPSCGPRIVSFTLVSLSHSISVCISLMPERSSRGARSISVRGEK